MNRREFLKLIGIGAGGVSLFGMARKEEAIKSNPAWVLPATHGTDKYLRTNGAGNYTWVGIEHPYWQGRVIDLPIKEVRIE